MSFTQFLPVFLVAAAVIALVLAAMAIGVIFKRPCLRGSCGGPAVHTSDGRKLSCENCPNRRR
jgi:hypothetical protein